MDWKSLGAQIANLGLPILGTALAGPAGATVGALIASTISNKLSPETPLNASQPALISQAIDKYGPQAVEALKVELEHDIKIRQLALDAEVVLLQDRQSARQMAIETTKATGKRDVNLMVISWLGILVALAVFGITVYLAIFKLMDAVSATLIGNMTGIFLAKYSTVFDFWMGGAKEHRQDSK